MQWVVYILECSDGTYYVGSTNDMSRRLYAHNTLKSGSHYTKIRRPVKLIYHENMSSLSQARKRESELKKLSKKQKYSLVNAKTMSV